MKSFWNYLAGTIFRPRKTFTSLLSDPQQISKATKAILLIGILYTLTVAGFALSGAMIMAPAWVNIPAENYYFWEIFFAMPVTILDWILVAGLIHLLSRWLKGSGTFEKTLAVLGFAIAIPNFVTWIIETAVVVLMITGVKTQAELVTIISNKGIWQLLWIGYQLLAVGWLFLLFPLAVAIAQKLSWLKALFVGVMAAVLFMAVMLIFIR